MLYQRILSALISKEGEDNENDDIESNGYGSTFEDETSLKSNGFMEFSGVCPFYGYGKNTAQLMVGAHISNTLVALGHGPKQFILCMGRVLSETLFFPNAVQKVDDEIDRLISDLENKYHEQVSSKTSVLDKILKTTTEAQGLQEKESKQDSVDKHTVLAYQKYMSCYGPKAPGGKSAGTKLANKQSLATVIQTLEKCHEFEMTGKSSITDNESGQPCP
nr:hypothetical protein [Tanacetum cinerariifolium]